MHNCFDSLKEEFVKNPKILHKWTESALIETTLYGAVTLEVLSRYSKTKEDFKNTLSQIIIKQSPKQRHEFLNMLNIDMGQNHTDLSESTKKTIAEVLLELQNNNQNQALQNRRFTTDCINVMRNNLTYESYIKIVNETYKAIIKDWLDPEEFKQMDYDEIVDFLVVINELNVSDKMYQESFNYFLEAFQNNSDLQRKFLGAIGVIVLDNKNGKNPDHSASTKEVKKFLVDIFKESQKNKNTAYNKLFEKINNFISQPISTSEPYWLYQRRYMLRNPTCWLIDTAFDFHKAEKPKNISQNY
ncbi:MAG: hypothetical protein HY843_02970 [Bdellovibrio sp.]|nr:hypothetical protein [Bdellovibrio sp.]